MNSPTFSVTSYQYNQGKPNGTKCYPQANKLLPAVLNDMSAVTVIIPVFSGWDSLANCLKHLAASSWRDFDTLVIDHSPPDIQHSLDLPYSSETNLRIVRASSDLWWTGATNVGIEEALKENEDGYIMLLNHDCYVASDTLSILVEQVKTNSGSIVAPVQVDANSKKVLVRRAYSCFLLGFSTLIPPALPVFNRIQPVISTGLIVGGRGVVIPRNVFRSVGLFDEKELPHYGADNDFYIRCKSAGYRLYISTRAVVEVDSSQTTHASAIGRQSLGQFVSTFRQRNSHRNIRDQMKLFKKHYPIPGLYPVGVLLNLLRYMVVYFILRARYLING